jgi:hypothetical protein
MTVIVKALNYRRDLKCANYFSKLAMTTINNKSLPARAEGDDEEEEKEIMTPRLTLFLSFVG